MAILTYVDNPMELEPEFRRIFILHGPIIARRAVSEKYAAAAKSFS
jgi:hypothetical protein